MLQHTWAALVVMWDRWKARSELLALDDRQLRDFGASRYDALMEARKPPWRD
jgi:uncharacterized protein YjiS (DUF1127 family)